MANTTNVHPTRLIEAIGAPRTWSRRIVDLFTHRMLAKLVSLGLATLLVFLIDSELTDDLYYEAVNVVQEGQGKGRYDLEVIVHPDFIMMPALGESEKPRLRIRGFRKFQNEIPVPLRAYIPEARLAGIGDEQTPISVEAGDLEPPNFGRGGVTLTPAPKIRVVRKARAERTLIHRDSRFSPSESEFTVKFTPQRVRLEGPGSALRSIQDPIVVNVDAPGRRTLRATELGLPQHIVILGDPVTM
jgi:hypothetical protein